MSPLIQAGPGIERSVTVALAAVIAIPVRDERDRIAGCLDALLRQTDALPGSLGIICFLNNCTDGTQEVIAELAARAIHPIRVLEEDSDRASAGWARRRAMDAAADWLEAEGCRDGRLLTTDADTRVADDWVARNLAAIAAGADAVAGRIVLEPADAEALPPSPHARGRLEAEYEAILTEIGARLDPDPANPWPCHWSKSGATIALRLSVYRRVGGVPDMPLGEDRALIDAVCAHDLIVRHEPDIVVTTSGRLDGRAVGGVADTMRFRCEVPDSVCDDRREPATRAVARVLLRRYLRRLYATGCLTSTRRWAQVLGISKQTAAALARKPHCGAALNAIEAASPRLAFHPLRPRQLPRQIRRARLILRIIRLCERAPGKARPGDSLAWRNSDADEPIDALSSPGASSPTSG